MAEYRKCSNKRCRLIIDSALLPCTDGIDVLTMHPYCPECGEDKWEDVERICNECEKAEAAPNDDLCNACRDEEDEHGFDLDNIDIPSPQRRRRDLMDAILGIARGAQIPEEIEL